MKYTLYLMLAINICLLFSCQNKNKKYINENAFNIAPDTVVKYIPKDKKGGNPQDFYYRIKSIQKILGLLDMENGYDSIQIRVWIESSFSDTVQLFVFKNNLKGYGAEAMILTPNISDSVQKYHIEKRDLTFLNSDSIVKEVLRKITSKNLMDLPDMDQFDNYPIIADGDVVVFETSTRKKYRIIRYQEPLIASDAGIAEAKNVIEILSIIQKELKLPALRIIEQKGKLSRKILEMPAIYKDSISAK